MKRKCTQCGKEEGEKYVESEKRVVDFSPRSSVCKKCKCEYMANRKQFLKESEEEYIVPDLAKSEDEKHLTFEGWEHIWPHITDEDILLGLDIMQSAGLRVHELLDLRMDDFDFRNSTLKVRSLKKRKKRPPYEIPIRPDIMEEIIRRNKDTCFKCISYDKLYATFKTAIKHVGLRERLSLHSLRHLCAMRMKRAGGDIAQIAKLLRHERERDVTMGYLHTNIEELKDLAKKSWQDQIWLWNPSVITYLYWGGEPIDSPMGNIYVCNSYNASLYWAKKMGKDLDITPKIMKGKPKSKLLVRLRKELRGDEDGLILLPKSNHNVRSYELFSLDKLDIEHIEVSPWDYTEEERKFYWWVYEYQR